MVLLISSTLLHTYKFINLILFTFLSVKVSFSLCYLIYYSISCSLCNAHFREFVPQHLSPITSWQWVEITAMASSCVTLKANAHLANSPKDHIFRLESTFLGERVKVGLNSSAFVANQLAKCSRSQRRVPHDVASAILTSNDAKESVVSWIWFWDSRSTSLDLFLCLGVCIFIWCVLSFSPCKCLHSWDEGLILKMLFPSYWVEDPGSNSFPSPNELPHLR